MALLPPGISPGSQRQPGAPQSHQLPAVVCPASATVENAVGLLGVREDETKSGRAKMQTAAMNSRILTGCSSKIELADSDIMLRRCRSLQHVVARHLAKSAHSKEALLGLANELIHFAEQAYAMRDIGVLQDVSDLLINVPVTEARQVGLYYRAIAINRKGEISEAEVLLEEIANHGPITYRARALQTLGANRHDKGQPDEALRFQLEALRLAADRSAKGLQTALLASLEIATITSINENHTAALASLESLAPLVRIVSRENPLYFYFYHNELAVEFAASGRIAEAEAACAIALASPFAAAYPEWSQTRDEIAAKRQAASQSVVAIHRAPEADRAPQAESQRNAKLVVRFVSGYQASNKDFFQRSNIPIPARTTIALNPVGILDRMLSCIGPRAPPARS